MYKIPESWGEKRTPRTPPNMREQDTFGLSFTEQFDWDILFAEAVRVNDDQVFLIGAPLYELANKLVITDDNGVVPHQVVNMDRVSITIAQTTSNRLYVAETVINVEDKCQDFAGVPSITTMQKNEPIQWIVDWITYYREEHGIIGFCIYNNNSTDYTNEELSGAVSSIEGVKVKVIDWSMPYGPETPYWDSDYSRYVMYECFKFKYGWCSKYVLNQDIDELFVVDGGTADDVYGYLMGTEYASIVYGNRNIDAYNKRLECSASELPVSERVFKDYYSYSSDINTNEMTGGKYAICKWMTIPERSIRTQWKNHDVGQNTLVVDKSEWQIYFAHFYPLQSKNQEFKSWDRNISTEIKEDLQVDELLKEKLERIFK